MNGLRSVNRNLFCDSFELASALPTASANKTSGNIKFVHCILVLLNFIFDTSKHTLPSYVVANILDIFFMWGVNSLPCLLLFRSNVIY